MRESDPPVLIQDVHSAEFFRDAVTAAMNRQHLAAADTTVFYVVNLLNSFLTADHLFADSDEGLLSRPLADVYLEAIEAPTEQSRTTLLHRLGDIALFVSGVLPRSFATRLVGIDYYVAMGGNAYSCLSTSGVAGTRDLYLKVTFADLSNKFSGFVSVLTEVSQEARTGSDQSVVELYGEWFNTGNQAAARQLREVGVVVADFSPNRRHH
jgi:hypothetical protein